MVIEVAQSKQKNPAQFRPTYLYKLFMQLYWSFDEKLQKSCAWRGRTQKRPSRRSTM